ncbi:uncharacterized protein F5Z01DRAFT_643180 [Emericellopsis atlantica]|uniref:Uncharacterized protein n=1 Tax=Emericellopsis atlantica TaxID=2614577 RepID=A0A9P7ZV29_9HYPO|nr:uncharacterized protein F5Z01DRAFT_643180 [Emericellopsis atlantica]KAG9258412.1 hypothetical protein F5Z01DRAFT_643180 [Emericellopsis atlantica]
MVVSDQAPKSDALNAILCFSVSMRCVPRLDRVTGYMDLLLLEKVVSELSRSVIALAGVGSGGACFQHHSGETKFPAQELRSHLEDLYDFAFNEMDLRAWLERASEDGMGPFDLDHCLHGGHTRE